jgi:hypothetical protein
MRMNGFGYALRDTGHRRVPAPPERITGTTFDIAIYFAAAASSPITASSPLCQDGKCNPNAVRNRVVSSTE